MTIRATRLPYAHGIHAIDAGYVRPMLAAIHLVIEDGQAALIDSGVNASVPAVLAALAELGLPAAAVKWVMLTHVHLDHAGGAGLLLEHLPEARLTVHPRGAPHMRDPARLVAGTIAVYGEQATRALYGDIRAIDPERILETPDGTRLTLGAREFEFIDTPGHARHHVCIVDHGSQSVFTGDTFGLSYRELD
ncbi:MAG TPA: MBL fold metallo-hydrolase, partial [Burkholderiaceae bacterium]|nr:MBL fold metallo-hydrolase [Burkholderiaceae bacterium]